MCKIYKVNNRLQKITINKKMMHGFTLKEKNIYAAPALYLLLGICLPKYYYYYHYYFYFGQVFVPTKCSFLDVAVVLNPPQHKLI